MMTSSSIHGSIGSLLSGDFEFCGLSEITESRDGNYVVRVDPFQSVVVACCRGYLMHHEKEEEKARWSSSSDDG